MQVSNDVGLIQIAFCIVNDSYLVILNAGDRVWAYILEEEKFRRHDLNLREVDVDVSVLLERHADLDSTYPPEHMLGRSTVYYNSKSFDIDDACAGFTLFEGLGYQVHIWNSWKCSDLDMY